MKKGTEAAQCKNHKPLWLKLGILFPAISLVCGIVIYAAPGLATSLLELLTHSKWQFTVQLFDATNFIIGLALWAIIGTLVGWAFTRMCDCCDEKQDRKK